MKSPVIGVLLSVVLLSSCSRDDKSPVVPPENHGNQSPTIPYNIDITKSKALLTRHYIRTYLVANSNSLIQVVVPLPKEKTTDLRVAIDNRKYAAATLHEGPNVVKYIIPSGASPLMPNDPRSFSRHQAASGFLTYSCTGPSGRLPPKREIILSVDQVDFGDGKLFSVERTSFTALPPP